MENAWAIISREPKVPEGALTDGFVMRFDRMLDWNILSSHYSFSVEMLRIYQHKVNWVSILKRRFFLESFLREMAPNFNKESWGVIARIQHLSESFIHDFADKFDWDDILLYQSVSARFLDAHKSYFYPGSQNVVGQDVVGR